MGNVEVEVQRAGQAYQRIFQSIRGTLLVWQLLPDFDFDPSTVRRQVHLGWSWVLCVRGTLRLFGASKRVNRRRQHFGVFGRVD